MVRTSALLAQLALRLRADREGTELPLRMPGFPWLTGTGLVILTAILVANWLHHRSGKVSGRVEASHSAKQPVLID